MSDHLVRVSNLKAVQKANGWSDSELGRQVGRTPQQVRSWFTPQGGRQIGERLARDLEERLRLPRYALDERTPNPHLGDVSADRLRIGAMHTSVTTRSREVPVLTWTDLERMLDVESSALRSKAPHLETFAPAGPAAKFVAMPDDSMAPEISAGDHLLFDPSEPARAGDVVLVRLPNGEHFVRTYRPRTAHVFVAVPANPDYQQLGSVDDQATVVAVMLEHRRYRRPR